jgi:hypothetical protein
MYGIGFSLSDTASVVLDFNVEVEGKIRFVLPYAVNIWANKNLSFFFNFLNFAFWANLRFLYLLIGT